MNPTFGAALLRALQAGRNLGPRGMPVTEERVTAALEAGFIEVNGRRIPVTGHGARGLRPGQKVAVAWQRGQPTVGIRHSARRSGVVGPQPQRRGQIIEELIVAPIQAGSATRDVWFRNGGTIGRLGVNTALGRSPSTRGNMWGLSRQHFTVAHSPNPTLHPHYAVFTVGAEDGTPRDPERILDDVPIARLVQDYDLSTANIALGQYTTMYSGSFTYNPVINVGTLFSAPIGQPGYSSGDDVVEYEGIIEDAMVDERGHLLIAIGLNISYFPTSTISRGALVSYVVDLTDGVVLYDGAVQSPALFGITALDPTFINLDTIPNTGAPDFNYLFPFARYGLFFLHAVAGTLTMVGSAAYYWPRVSVALPISMAAGMVKIQTPTSSMTLQPYTVGTDQSSPTTGMKVVYGLSAEYVFWVPFSRTGGAGFTHSLPFSGAVTSGVNMTRFVEPTETQQVSADLDSFFTPRLTLIEPTALYNTTDSNETGHVFVEYLGPDGGLVLDTTAPGFPLQDTRPGDEAGFLLDYPSDLAFIATFLEDQVAGETAEFADVVLAEFTDHQLIPDPVAVRELPI